MNTLGIVLITLIFLGVGLGLMFIKVHENMEEARRLQRQKAIRYARKERELQQLHNDDDFAERLKDEW